MTTPEKTAAAPDVPAGEQEPLLSEIEAPGLVFMVAYGDNREVCGMFDTAQQAHAFVQRLDAAMQKDAAVTLGGGLPGDHNGTAPVQPTALADREKELLREIRVNFADDGLSDLLLRLERGEVSAVQPTVRMLTTNELMECLLVPAGGGYSPTAIQRAYERVNAGRTIPNKEE